MLYSINSENVASRILDDGAVVINYQTGYYFSLNQSGTLIWEWLGQRAMTLDELSASLAKEFELQKEDVTSQVANLLNDLVKEGLLIAGESYGKETN